MYYAARDYFESYRLRARCKLVRIPPSASLQIKSPASAAVQQSKWRLKGCRVHAVDGRARSCTLPISTWHQWTPRLIVFMSLLHASRDSPARCRSSSSLSASRDNNEIYRQYTLSANEANKGVYWQLIQLVQIETLIAEVIQNNAILELRYRKQVARQLRTQYFEGFYRPKYYTVTLKSRLRVTQGHCKRNHWIDHTRLSSSRVIWRWILSWPWNVACRSLKVIENGILKA